MNIQFGLACVFGILYATLINKSQCIEFKSLDHIRTKTAVSVQKEAVEGLIQRILPSRYDDFIIKVDPDLCENNRDTFRLESVGDKLAVSGSSGVAASWGLHYYLTQYCSAHVSWAGLQVALPDILPKIPQPVTISANDRFRYYQNVCTVSYSFTWWSWTRWQQEIDWMALHGINLPLAFSAQEAVWQRVYLSMGFTQKELNDHFGGPAFLAWSRMGNIRGWGGPLSSSWHSQQVTLQHKILDRMRAFGMTPVLPAFAGHVPVSITKHYPNVSISRLGDWGHFNETYCCTALLDISDPLFQTIGKAFIDEYTKEFGTDHVYNADTFNEMTPKSSSAEYLFNASRNVFSAMLAGDKLAIWVMQGWLFLDAAFWGPPQIKALLTGVPKGRMIVLDLYSEVAPIYSHTDSYYGQPFIWCMLHNFGGTVAMYGAVESINHNPFGGRSFPNSSMVGIGLTPEGINQNNVMYEFMMENSWRKQPRDISAWASDYARRRYGADNELVSKAWKIFMSGVYNSSHYHNGERDVFLVNLPHIADSSQQLVWYDPEEFFRGWDYMLKASRNLTKSILFRYDLVDVTRQALQLISVMYYTQLVQAYNDKDPDGVLKFGYQFISLMDDLDDLLGTDEHFLLGRWLEDAKSAADYDADRELFEYNARTQITTWGPTGEILDYANKQWSGLVRGYYKPRWQLFITELVTALYKNTTYNANKFKDDVFRLVEQPFTVERNIYPSSQIGDQIQESFSIHAKYRPATVEYEKFFKSLPAVSARGKKLKKFAQTFV